MSEWKQHKCSIVCLVSDALRVSQSFLIYILMGLLWKGRPGKAEDWAICVNGPTPAGWNFTFTASCVWVFIKGLLLISMQAITEFDDLGKISVIPAGFN